MSAVGHSSLVPRLCRTIPVDTARAQSASSNDTAAIRKDREGDVLSSARIRSTYGVETAGLPLAERRTR